VNQKCLQRGPPRADDGDVSTQAVFCHSPLKDSLRILRHCHLFDARLRECVAGCPAIDESVRIEASHFHDHRLSANSSPDDATQQQDDADRLEYCDGDDHCRWSTYDALPERWQHAGESIPGLFSIQIHPSQTVESLSSKPDGMEKFPGKSMTKHLILWWRNGGVVSCADGNSGRLWQRQGRAVARSSLRAVDCGVHGTVLRGRRVVPA
jgi:hypothetical protein